MHKLSKTAFHEIRKWIYQNARPLDFALWRYYFENGKKEEILRILQSYQNSDGGFGNTIDSDNWNPESSPYGAQYTEEDKYWEMLKEVITEHVRQITREQWKELERAIEV